MFLLGSLPSAIDVQAAKSCCALMPYKYCKSLYARQLVARQCALHTLHKRDVLPDQIGIKGAPCGVS